jgi:transcriptional regulator with XRE-family HTH domain
VAKTTVDPVRLYESLEASRVARGLSWRGLAAEIGVSPSLLSRLRQGFRPDANGFATIVDWLGLEAEVFFDRATDEPRQNTALMSRVAPLLRADKNLKEEDIRFITNVINAALERTQVPE